MIPLLCILVVNAPYSTVYVFGDSFSDMGARYVDTNGPTAVVYLAQLMGLQMTFPQDKCAKYQSINFASSGATSGKETPRSKSNKDCWCQQGMTDQVEDFVHRARSGGVSFQPERTLFFIAGGLNDRELPTQVTIENLTHAIGLLQAAGARHIWLALLPEKIPPFTATAIRLNAAYRQLVPHFKTRTGLDIRLSRWGEYYDEIMTEPNHYGIENTTSRCAGRALFGEDTMPCDSPHTYYYYHDGHPSTAVHKIVGGKLYSEIMSGAASAKSH